MRARKVKGLEAGMPLADAAERIVRTRLRELCRLAARAQEPEQTTALHDTRIAAKRLRYVLEITAECFGPYAQTATKKAKEIQDLLGEIHDADEMLPWLEDVRRRLRDRDAAHLVGAGLEGDPPRIAAYRGLERLDVELFARRAKLFADWKGLWLELQRQGFRARLEHAVTERVNELATSEAVTHPAGTVEP
jgi:CHAD domain-containing protein